MNTPKAFISLFFFLSFLFISSINSQNTDSKIDWSELPPFPVKIGLNGMYTGMHNDALILAGGTNFPNRPVWEGGQKKWYDSIFVLPPNSSEWIVTETKLPQEMANGFSITTSKGVLCIGGDNEAQVLNSVYLLKWNPKTTKVDIDKLPSLPIPLTNMGGSIIGDMVYLVGGQESKTDRSTSVFLSFNISAQLNREVYTWQQLTDFPGKHRIQPIVVGQSNGHEDCLYVMSGLSYSPDSDNKYEMLSDVYQFNPQSRIWIQKQPIPENQTPGLTNGYLAAAPVIKEGNSHILIFGGAGGQHQFLKERLEISQQLKKLDLTKDTLFFKQLKLKEIDLIKKSSFSKTVWAYHTITDTWLKVAEMPAASQIVTNAISNRNSIIIAGGEIAPGQRTNRVLVAKILTTKVSFGWVNYVTLIMYLLLMVFLGYYFSKRNKTTNDYFLGGGRIPWWAAGLSIYATMLSAITYLSQPALAYSFDWQAYLGYFTILLLVPIVITFYLPFFRKLNVTTAYEYLEKRFNVTLRMFGSTSFVLFQLVRMGIVVYLPALALSTVIGMNIYIAIIIMGILSILYTYMGGIEAVVWTDVIQVLVLLLGLIAGLFFIAYEIGDIGYIFKTAWEDNKLRLFDWRISFTEVVTWSLFFGSFALNFAPYTTDQAVVQRYMTTSSEKASRKSIWLNGIISIPAGILIFLMGTFLYVYFKVHPEFLAIGMQNDSVFPLFISNHLPPGIGGLVIAGIYSASMSSLDSSMHSVSTVVTVDYYKRFSESYSEVKGLKLARLITILVGILGTMIACLMAAFPVKSLFFLFQEVIGLFGSALTGIFILGIFVKKANWKGTLAGAILSVIVLAFVKYQTPINFYIYPLIAIPICVIGGIIFSMFFKVKKNNYKGLVYERMKKNT